MSSRTHLLYPRLLPMLKRSAASFWKPISPINSTVFSNLIGEAATALESAGFVNFLGEGLQGEDVCAFDCIVWQAICKSYFPFCFVLTPWLSTDLLLGTADFPFEDRNDIPPFNLLVCLQFRTVSFLSQPLSRCLRNETNNFDRHYHIFCCCNHGSCSFCFSSSCDSFLPAATVCCIVLDWSTNICTSCIGNYLRCPSTILVCTTICRSLCCPSNIFHCTTTCCYECRTCCIYGWCFAHLPFWKSICKYLIPHSSLSKFVKHMLTIVDRLISSTLSS